MRKIFALLVVLIMGLTMMVGCGSGTEDEGATEIANPIHECDSQDEVTQATGISIDAPEGATDVFYAYIDDADGKPAISEVGFTYEGKSYIYRAKATAEPVFGKDMEGEDLEGAVGAMEAAIEEGQTMAGYYAEWSGTASVEVDYCNAVYCSAKDGTAFIVWEDVVPGIMYTLGSTDGASEDELLALANKCFVPAQGDN